MAELAARDLHYSRGGRTILEGVSLEVSTGEFVALAGPSGSGKTSLLLVLAGLLPADSGVVYLNGLAVDEWSSMMRASIGVVLQTYRLMTYLSAEENVALPLQARHVPRQEIEEAVTSALQLVGLGAARHRLVGELSGGQKQRVAVARAIAGEPAVIIADEPTSELDHENRDRIIDLLCAKSASGSAVVVASHDPFVVSASSRALRLHAGRI
ncbi:MAG: ATP-binding cassette domain-containing protein, partial [Acidimicrobiales bacterium]